MSEISVQKLLYRFYFRKHNLLCPNIFLYNWESDFISVTKSGFVNEFEIKSSKQDFLNEQLKIDKFNILNESTKIESNLQRPNMFWYVCLDNLLEIKDIPKYAGLISFQKDRYWNLNILQKPKKLHKEKITENQKIKILTSIYYKYWFLKGREKNENS